jgi:hypothetical protein
MPIKGVEAETRRKTGRTASALCLRSLCLCLHQSISPSVVPPLSRACISLPPSDQAVCPRCSCGARKSGKGPAFGECRRRGRGELPRSGWVGLREGRVSGGWR